MASHTIQFRGGLLDREAQRLERLIEGYGFKVATDDESGLLVASRPRVIEKPDFLTAVVESGVDTRYYGGFAWGALSALHQKKLIHRMSWVPSAYDDLSLEFVSGSPAQVPNLLAIETLPSTIDWVKNNEPHMRVSRERVTEAWQAVVQTYLAPQLDLPVDRV